MQQLTLVGFSKQDAAVFWQARPEHINPVEWLTHLDNPNRLSHKEIDFTGYVDDINYKSGEATFFRQESYVRKRFDWGVSTFRYHLRKVELLGIILTGKGFHNGKLINRHTINPEFSKYNQTKADHRTNQNRSQTQTKSKETTCWRCQKYYCAVTLEEELRAEYQKQIGDYERRLKHAENLAEVYKSKLDNQKAKEQLKLHKRKLHKESKQEKRKEFLSNLPLEKRLALETFEAVTRTKIDVERDLESWEKLSELNSLDIIIGIITSAVNFERRENFSQGKLQDLGTSTIRPEKASIYSLKYCVPQCLATQLQCQKLGKPTLAGYLGRLIAELNPVTAQEVLSIIAKLPKQEIGEKGLEGLLGHFAAKMVSKQVVAGEIEPTEKEQAFREYYEGLLMEYSPPLKA